MSQDDAGAAAEQGRLRVAGVLLAAGSSTRFGVANKLTATLSGKPLVRHVADTLAGCDLAEIVVVTGPDADDVAAALDGLALRLVANTEHLAGMGGSVAVGIGAVAADVDGALVTPGDMPGLTPALIARLIAAFRAHGGQAIVHAATPEGQQRNPVIWPRRLFARLAGLQGAEGAKSVIAEHRDAAVAVTADDAHFEDVDTTADLDRIAARRAPGA